MRELQRRRQAVHLTRMAKESEFARPSWMGRAERGSGHGIDSSMKWQRLVLHGHDSLAWYGVVAGMG